jgi:ATP-dependent Clp protease ATP-binding subunit ClpA
MASLEGGTMYERFTDRARKVMQLANQEAQHFKHEYIGTEHILLGLVKEDSGVAANVLKNLEINLPKVRREIEKIVQAGPDAVTMGKLPQTPRAKRVIEFAIEEARALNHMYIGTEHLLLGLIREDEGVAAQVLINLGLSLPVVREEVQRVLGISATSERFDEAQELAALPPRIRKAIMNLDEVMELFTRMKEEAVTFQDFDWAARLRDQADKLQRVRVFLLRELKDRRE